MKEIQDFNYIQFIDFWNAHLDFSKSWFNELEFTYKSKTYNWKVYMRGNEFYFEDTNKITNIIPFIKTCKMLTKAKLNEVMEHEDFYFTLTPDKRGYNQPLTIENIFKDNKLGILTND